MCVYVFIAALCNDSHLQYSASRGVYQPVGEATEVALRVFAEKASFEINKKLLIS